MYTGNRLLAGTHDNETAAGWWADSANEKDRNYITSYLQFDGQDIAGAFTRAAYSSVAKTAIIMIQASRAAYNLAIKKPKIRRPCHARKETEV